MKSVVGNKLTGWCALPVSSSSGGILIAWDPMKGLKIDEIMGNFLVSIKFMDVFSSFEWMTFGVYDPCRP